jgi:glycosyltransferase involved in cell wall biosynthesis
MKILMVISQFHPIVGGAERQAQLLGKTLIKKGVDVRIVTGWWVFGTPRNEIVDGIKVFRNFSCWRMFGIKGVRTLGGLAYMVSLGLHLLMHRREYDVVHVHQALYPAFVAVLVGQGMLGKSVLVKTGSSGMTSDFKQLRRFPLGGFQLNYMLKKLECLVAVSQMSGKEYLEIGYPESRMVYIPNGVAVSSERKKTYDRLRNVVTTTRLSREKGIDVLLQAWARLAQTEKGLKLFIVGHGPLESELRGLCKSLGIGDSVEFCGLTKNVEKYLEAADFFVLPSRTEGLSNSLLEAMGHGIPCVATDVGGSGDLLQGENEKISPGGYIVGRNGLLVNPDDPQGLSEAMGFLIRRGEGNEEMGRRGRAFVQENYSIDRVADRYIALYRELLNRSC